MTAPPSTFLAKLQSQNALNSSLLLAHFRSYLLRHPDALDSRSRFSELLAEYFPHDPVVVNLLLQLYDIGIHTEIERTDSATGYIVNRYVSRLMNEYGTDRRNAESAVALFCACYGGGLQGKPCDSTYLSDASAPRYSSTRPLPSYSDAIEKIKLDTEPPRLKIELPDYWEAKEKIIAMLLDHGGLSPFEAQSGLGLNGNDGAPELIRRIFDELEMAGKIEAQEHESGIRYVLKRISAVPHTASTVTDDKETERGGVQVTQEDHAQAHGKVTRVPPESSTNAPGLHGLNPGKIMQVLSTRFSNGILVGSVIELDRFRHFAADMDGLKALPDEALRAALEACGTFFDGKVYAVSESVKARLVDLTEAYFATGAKAIFYEEFYDKHRSWLFRSSLTSPEMLKVVLAELFPNLYFKQTYFGHTHAPVKVVVGTEILRVWGDDAIATYARLAEQLPYVPLKSIKNALAPPDFIWNSPDTYTHISKISIAPEEREAIREYVAAECDAQDAKGYASLAELPMGYIEQLNPDLSITALHDAIFRVCLSDTFSRQGKIVTRESGALDALELMKRHLGAMDRCTLDDLLDFWKELTGVETVINKDRPLKVGHEVMVRIDRENYVAERHLDFDTVAIDEAIGQFVPGEYLPLKSFTTFGTFPDCGRPWSLYLLESYCRRFSPAFRFDARQANSVNAGAIIRKSCKMTYMQIMADAVAKSGIALRQSDVCRFLYDNGYIGKTTTSSAGEVSDKAGKLRSLEGKGA